MVAPSDDARRGRRETDPGPGLPPLLTTQQGAERYGLRDTAAARKIMRDAGRIMTRNRMFLRADALERVENVLAGCSALYRAIAAQRPATAVCRRDAADAREGQR